jgi:hypothetical protein
MICTTFANDVNPFRTIRKAAPKMTRREVCNFVQSTGRAVTTHEVMVHFDLPLTNVSRLLSELRKEGAISCSKHVNTGDNQDLRTKNAYTYIRPSQEGRTDRIGPIIEYLIANPLATLKELSEVTKLTLMEAAQIMHHSTKKSGRTLRKRVDGRYVYWAAP